MKYLKQKLLAAISMVLIATIMMSTSTYAWFAISTAPEVSTVATTMSAYKSLEIALGTSEPSETTATDSGDETTWGSTVGVENALTATSAIALPATVSSGALATVAYDSAGRPNGITATGTVGNYSATTYMADITANGKVIGQAISFYLRTNTAGDITAVITGRATGTGIAIKVGADGTLTEVPSSSDSSVTIKTATANETIPIVLYIYYDGTDANNDDVTAVQNLGFTSMAFANSNI